MLDASPSPSYVVIFGGVVFSYPWLRRVGRVSRVVQREISRVLEFMISEDVQGGVVADDLEAPIGATVPSVAYFSGLYPPIIELDPHRRRDAEAIILAFNSNAHAPLPGRSAPRASLALHYAAFVTAQLAEMARPLDGEKSYSVRTL